jgi:hypothetical protein
MINRYIVETFEVVERRVRYTVDACDIDTAVELALEGEGFDEDVREQFVSDATVISVLEALEES